ncbi:bacterial low temperature requirement A protein-domain-containing protein [Powellomyces hirtus]|nr:bacterial low temperature requirement A protein-domain-containing protein [Powellomyces hirtus]
MANTSNPPPAALRSGSSLPDPTPVRAPQREIFINGPRQQKARKRERTGYAGFALGFAGSEEDDEEDDSDEAYEDSSAPAPPVVARPRNARDITSSNKTIAEGRDSEGGNQGGRPNEGDTVVDDGSGGTDRPQAGEGGKNKGDNVNDSHADGGDIGKHPQKPTDGSVAAVERIDGGQIETVEGAAAMFIDEEQEAKTAPDEHFTHDEFGNVEEIKLYDTLHDRHQHHPQNKPLTFLGRRLKPSPARQFFVGDVLYRERNARKVSWDELFSDLVYVGVVQQITHSVKEARAIDGKELNHLILVFTPVWLTWLNNQSYSNVFGTTTSFWHRLHAWLQMVLICGLGITCSHAFDPVLTSNTGHIFAVLYLISRLLYVLSYSKVFISMPKFSAYAGIRVVAVVVASVPWCVSLGFGVRERVWLWWIGLVVDALGRAVVYLVGGMGETRMKYRLAVNIEHCWERFGLLTMIFLGELVVSILWTSHKAEFNQTYIATVLGLTINICIQWIYYSVDGGKQFKHALRRHTVTGFLWQMIHLPFHLCIVAAGSTLSVLILRIGHLDEPHPELTASSPVEPWVRIIFVGGFGLVLVWMSLITLMHESSDREGVRVHRAVRIGVRMVSGVVLCVVAGVVGEGVKAMGLVGIVAGVFVFVAVFTQFAEVARKKVEDPEAHQAERSVPQAAPGNVRQELQSHVTSCAKAAQMSAVRPAMNSTSVLSVVFHNLTYLEPFARRGGPLPGHLAQAVDSPQDRAGKYSMFLFRAMGGHRPLTGSSETGSPDSSPV